MKTLKFMLAAATAIGLASASQAAGPYDGSTDFEADTLDSTITTSDSNWIVPTGAEDGDYKIITGVPSAALRSAGATSAFTDTPAQVLQLEGGTDPLLRNIQASGAAVDLTAGDVYIDTLVQFTVTPAGDPVTEGGSDKLLVYFKEVTNDVGTVTATNLIVKTCNFLASAVPGLPDTQDVVEIDTGVGYPTVEPNTWYRLTVKASSLDLGDDRYLPVFTIKVGANQLSAGAYLANGTTDMTLFPSILGPVVSPTITSVGFAGSGAVDDLLFTTFDPETTVLDFCLVLDGAMAGIDGDVSYQTTAMSGTLDSGTNTVYCYGSSASVTVTYALNTGYSASWDTDPNGATITKGAVYTLTVTQNPTGVDFTFALGTGVSAVTWTLNGVSASGTVQVKEADVLAITGVTYANWYVGTGDYTNGWTKTLAAADVADDFSYTVAALELGNSSAELPSGTQPSAVGISNAAITSADLNPVLEWARTKSGAADTADALTAINGMDFTEDAENQAAKAYLLNCANTSEAVAAAEAAFKFPAITPGTVPEVYVPVGGYNATPVIYGGNTLDAINVTPATGSHKFYKATLTK